MSPNHGELNTEYNFLKENTCLVCGQEWRFTFKQAEFSSATFKLNKCTALCFLDMGCMLPVLSTYLFIPVLFSLYVI